ncbi:MAG: MmcQ/YjbR family DNA-binding protein [Deltaproteobacteria bacterium]|nr:MmcQ/YjbR family DNA-binding protein [Deltaproteobacteria bacterium]
MAKKKASTDTVLLELRAFGLAYPGAHTKSPWPGHLDLAVKDKTFAYLSLEGEPFHITCKLPQSSSIALMLPGCKPAAYGLGKSGWVAGDFSDGKLPPTDVLKAWIDESYRAQAPKTLVKQLTTAAAPAPAKATAREKTKASSKTKTNAKTNAKTTAKPKAKPKTNAKAKPKTNAKKRRA